MTPNNIPKISIGLPVYNEEKFIQKKLESLLSLEFNDFELIISDNNSTDSTPTICQKFANQDKRIKFYQQSKNIGPWKNFGFVLEKSTSDYFVWTAADDNILPGFFEKNICVLESDSNVVCSVSQVERYGSKIDMFLSKKCDSFIQKIYKQFRRHFRTYGAKPLTGTFEQKAEKFLRYSAGQNFYGIFKTKLLQKSIKNIWTKKTEGELFLFLNILRYGDLYVLDEVLLNCWDGGSSSHGYLGSFRQKQISFFELFFPFYHHFVWCMKNLGIKFMLKTFDHWMWVSLWPLIMIPKEIISELFKK
jgi:glycosyltransferase involved in cell wall biosynthesis